MNLGEDNNKNNNNNINSKFTQGIIVGYNKIPVDH